MRGKGLGQLLDVAVGRITPAYAGKRQAVSSISLAVRDHPRLCGEKALRAWADHGKLRITPAYAGKSPTDPPLAFSNQDHPRLCGEKGFAVSHSVIFTGSPPPMRGKEEKQYTVKNGKGITPAYAGKSIENNAEAKAL